MMEVSKEMMRAPPCIGAFQNTIFKNKNKKQNKTNIKRPNKPVFNQNK